ncbi:unnamed protein product [Sphenostylis stenocarpa]|uniref:Uncharacterized protein n=1 Tax=Sphenostylis stenocarpa TaxID=92480 RepID=A0AA86V568_9FABA|nr:unnamed protein product [Sphenostylis stenocarpa]
MTRSILWSFLHPGVFQMTELVKPDTVVENHVEECCCGVTEHVLLEYEERE